MAPPADQVVAFAPGRANLIGEHTDYNDGLALPFAIELGVTVTAAPRDDGVVWARAAERPETDAFPVVPAPTERRGDWRDFVRGAVAELAGAGFELAGADLAIEPAIPGGVGLSSSAAITVALCLALLAAAEQPPPADRITLARLCSRVEHDWLGARTGLLDQIASLLGEPGHALRIDFHTLDVRTVPLVLDGWRLVTVPSWEMRSLAKSGYNERRAECERARELLGLGSLRDADVGAAADLPPPLGDRVRHVVEENARVDAAVAALEAGDLTELGSLLDASHEGLRDLYASSTPAVERTVRAVRDAGAAGARMMGGGFGGGVLALLPPGATPPAHAIPLEPSAGAQLLGA